MAQALGKLGDPRAVEPLLAMMREQEKDIPPFVRRIHRQIAATKLNESRLVAAKVLLQLDDKRGVEFISEPLAAFLQKPDYRDARKLEETIKVLAQVRDAHVVEPLVKLLVRCHNFMVGYRQDHARSSSHFVGAMILSLATINALEQIGDSRAAEALVMALRSPSEDVKRAARSAVKKMDASNVLRALVSVLEEDETKPVPEKKQYLDTWIFLEEKEEHEMLKEIQSFILTLIMQATAEDLRRLAQLKDRRRRALRWHFSDDPWSDSGGYLDLDLIQANYSRVRQAAQQELKRRGLDG